MTEVGGPPLNSGGAAPKPVILHVDDDEPTLYAVSRLLTREGFEVVHARTGAEALRLLRPSHALVILDVRLPDMLGYEVSRLIRAQPTTANIPILHLSVLADEAQHRIAALDAGGNAFLGTRAEPDELLATVRALLRVSASHAQVEQADQMLRQRLAYVTQLYEAAEEARVAAEAAQASLTNMDRLKDEFLAMLAHELRTPLGTMGNVVELIRRRTEEDEVLRRDCDKLDRQVKQMSRLVADLMDLSRIRSGKVELRRERVDLTAIVKRVYDECGRVAEARQQQLVLKVPEPPLWVCADETRLVQVFTNLVGNASKYTDSGGTIWFEARAEGKDLVVSIRDTGIGIDPAALPTLFDLFTQASNTSDRAVDGLGVGLALVKSLVELHAGEVRAYSQGPGQGSEFEVRLSASGD